MRFVRRTPLVLLLFQIRQGLFGMRSVGCEACRRCARGFLPAYRCWW